MTLISKNVNIDEVDDIKTIEQLDIYHRTIKMKSVDVDANMCIDFNKENIKGSPNFKTGDNVRISKYKTVIAKGYVPNSSNETFEIPKIRKYCSVDICY